MLSSDMKTHMGVVLITYPDSLGGNLAGIQYCMNHYFGKAFQGIHILPFFPSTGDRGFAPVGYDTVDKAFGDWGQIQELGNAYELYCDVMVNHISTKSTEFQDYLKNGENSVYSDMFLDFEQFLGKNYRDTADYKRLYRRKDADPFLTVMFEDGSEKKIWNTFRETQIDIDVTKDVTKEYLKHTMDGLLEKGIGGIRLDAAGYVTKVKGTSCFCVEPQLWEFLQPFNEYVKSKGGFLFTEIHARWEMAKKLEAHGIWTYDFVLPFLTLHGLVSGRAEKLVDWLKTAPRNQFTVLDTHDGIGVYDADGWVERSDAEETIHKIEDRLSYAYREISPEKKRYWESYQLYGTYFSILKEDEQRYLCARAIQMFAPGVPMVYYVGLLAGRNDVDALMQSPDHRDINRHNFTYSEIEAGVKQRVVQRLLKLLVFRNNCVAFDGEMDVSLINSQEFSVRRMGHGDEANLVCNLITGAFTISHCAGGRNEVIEI